MYENDYGDAYVLDALLKTGLTKAQGEWILLSAELENLKHRRKVNGAIALVMGIGWLIIGALFFITKDDPENTALVQSGPEISLRHWLIAAIVFLGGLLNFIVSAVRVKKLQGTFPAEPPVY